MYKRQEGTLVGGMCAPGDFSEEKHAKGDLRLATVNEYIEQRREGEYRRETEREGNSIRRLRSESLLADGCWYRSFDTDR